MRLVPPEYCCAALVNDPKRINISLESVLGNAPAASGGSSVSNQQQRRSNVAMIALEKPHTIRSITDYEYVRLETTRDIKKDEELFLSYGSSYWGRQSANRRETNERLFHS